MKCCAVANDNTQPHPLQMPDSRSGFSAGPLLAVLLTLHLSFHSLPTGREDFRPATTAISAPVFSSLSRLCIRLI